ncbi:MAG TPA: AAA family ATPase, partial [Allocoleopsis sp.]
MTSISGYKILDQLDETDQSLVYRGIREIDETKVIIKVLKDDYPTAAQITAYKQEYHITSSFNLPGVIKSYSLEKYQDKLAIILENFPGESLKKIIKQQIFSLTEFLDIAIKISDVLGHIHAANIIHKDINPSNILYDQQNQEIKIIDFGISSILPRSQPCIKNPDLLEGTLAYISPEQTGRMNRSLDYRTDFYSVGVTFYQILTNTLPFTTQDTLELVYSHIAKQPLPPSHINPEIPGIIDQIVMKLLAKNAEDRYQSSWGLKADLILALMQLEAHGGIEYFILGESDIHLQFQIPQKLYGREEEIQTLLSAFKRIITNNNNQQEIMLLLGDSGLGKSALIQEMYKMIMGEKGYFVSGKFAQYQRNIPYSALINALQELVKQILIENETKLKEWKTKILQALGQQGSIIIDVIPEVELIIGIQPSVPELDPKETENRFNLVFQKFINVFCHQDHPLVIFLDDLQWIDSATLKLLQVIMTDNQSKYLFLICAYQDNEVNANHPLI